eukprot:363309-Chlamydomonas_euryale.AAC.9
MAAHMRTTSDLMLTLLLLLAYTHIDKEAYAARQAQRGKSREHCETGFSLGLSYYPPGRAPSQYMPTAPHSSCNT